MSRLRAEHCPPSPRKRQGSNDRSLNNYLSIEEKHIWSNNVISSSRIGYVRTLTGAAASNGYSDFAWQPNLWGSYSSLFPAGPQGSINILSMTNPNITRQILGGGTAFRFIQNKYSAGEDIYWNKGAHSLQFGVSAIWVQSYGVSPTSPGAWTFANMTGFLTEEPVSGTAVCNGAQFAACSSIPTLSQVQHYREIDFGFYVQDTWKVRSNVTLNLGLRYSPETNPLAIGGVQEFVNMPLSPSYNPNFAYARMRYTDELPCAGRGHLADDPYEPCLSVKSNAAQLRAARWHCVGSVQGPQDFGASGLWNIHVAGTPVRLHEWHERRRVYPNSIYHSFN